MPDIYIDDQVYDWLQSLATPFEDTPNSVLRRVAGLESWSVAIPATTRHSRTSHGEPIRLPATVRTTWKTLAKDWNVDVVQGRYHRDGHWYQNLTEFPGALFDPDGYVIFSTEEEYLNSPYLDIGIKTNLRGGASGGGIKQIPGYHHSTL